jgi:hypothetical protein
MLYKVRNEGMVDMSMRLQSMLGKHGVLPLQAMIAHYESSSQSTCKQDGEGYGYDVQSISSSSLCPSSYAVHFMP